MVDPDDRVVLLCNSDAAVRTLQKWYCSYMNGSSTAQALISVRTLPKKSLTGWGLSANPWHELSSEGEAKAGSRHESLEPYEVVAFYDVERR